MINNWSVEVQLYCVLKLYLTYGVIKSSELINCLITDTDCDDNTNYINVNKKQIVINHHKNDRIGKKLLILMTTSYLEFYGKVFVGF